MSMDKVDERGFRAVEGVAIKIRRDLSKDVNEPHVSQIRSNTHESKRVKKDAQGCYRIFANVVLYRHYDRLQLAIELLQYKKITLI
jgi:hypothetical protein